MESRLQNLFHSIIKEYVATAEPVGSQLMAKKYFKDLSAATIRNDMAQLEEQSLIFQPHISAGRIPTEEGWQYYLKNILQECELEAKTKQEVKQLVKKLKSDHEVGLKDLAKNLAESSQNAILVGFGPHNVYYTGLANLFSQPEFSNQQVVYSISSVIDHLDDIISRIFEGVKGEVQVLAGSQNPFSSDCGVILGRYQSADTDSGILGVLGPIRMDYERNVSLIKYVLQIINGYG